MWLSVNWIFPWDQFGKQMKSERGKDLKETRKKSWIETSFRWDSVQSHDWFVSNA